MAGDSLGLAGAGGRGWLGFWLLDLAISCGCGMGGGVIAKELWPVVIDCPGCVRRC